MGHRTQSPSIFAELTIFPPVQQWLSATYFRNDITRLPRQIRYGTFSKDFQAVIDIIIIDDNRSSNPPTLSNNSRLVILTAPVTAK